MGWVFLFIAIVLEVCGTTSMKLSEGLTRLAPSIAMFVFYGFAFTMLSFSLKTIELGIAYAIWSGLGTALIAVIGITWFGESTSIYKIASILLIIIGVLGLNLGPGARA